MPNPFPGVDPFLEGQVWREFHTHLVSELQVYLAPRLRPRYVVRMEEDILIEDEPEPSPPPQPDVSISRSVRAGTAVLERVGNVTEPPFTIPVSLPRPHRQRYLEVRLRSDERVVTVIEVLSPTNKGLNTGGRADYLRKRERLFSGPVNIVEIDLLRGGARLPMAEPLPIGDYYVIVSRASARPLCDVWPGTLRQPLPSFPLPLAEGDPPMAVELQEVYSTAYDRVGYEQILRYDQGVVPPLSRDDAAWVNARLGDREAAGR